MEGYAWGGSEELWYRTALICLEHKIRVIICVKDWPVEPSQIQNLRSKSAVIVKRKTFTDPLFKRALRKIKDNRYTYYNKLSDLKPDFVLVSQGGTFDFFCNLKLVHLIKNLKKPYSIISQLNVENGQILPSAIQQTIKAFDVNFKRFYFVSQRNLDTAERQAACLFANASIVDNPVNINKIEIKKWTSTGSLQIACVARYECTYKGQDLLIQTLADPIFRENDYQLNFYGKGPDMEHLKNLIALYGLKDKIFIHGHLSNIDQVWENNHFLILPSIAEGTPLALQECMLQGRAALVTDVGDCCKFIIDGETGFSVPVSSVKALKNGLIRLFSIPRFELKNMGEKAYYNALKLIDLSSPSNLYKEIISFSEETIG